MDMARGLADWQRKREEERTLRGGTKRNNDVDRDMEAALYRFFTARVGLRFMTEHFVLSSPYPETESLRRMTDFLSFNRDDDDDSESETDPDDNAEPRESRHHRGCIDSNCHVVRETERVAAIVYQQTVDHYGVCPAIDIVDCIEHPHEDENDDDGDRTTSSLTASVVSSQQAKSLKPSKKNRYKNKSHRARSFTYVPHHLHYMLAELLKNSCRATVEKYRGEEGSDASHSQQPELPPVRVVIVKGDEDVTIKVADKGGGIPRSMMESIFKFSYKLAVPATTSAQASPSAFGTDAVTGAPVRGFGLPLARIYSRYFGGELTLKSTEGYGLDAYLHLPRLGDNGENLPLRVRDSPAGLVSLPTTKHV
jgi:signal transduction histidine kinase